MRPTTHPQNDPEYRRMVARLSEIISKYTGSSNPSEEEQAEEERLDMALRKIERDYKFSFAGMLQESDQTLTGVLDTLFLHPLPQTVAPEEHKAAMKEAEVLLLQAQTIMRTTLEKL